MFSGSPDIISLASCNIVRENLSPNVSGDDPDVQIIENPEPSKQRSIRKRPQRSVRVMKDHLKNPIYNVIFVKSFFFLEKN